MHLALQSQMNPHFLYNTLTTISILAEEEDTEKIVQICEDLTALLRYISSGSDREVPLSMEIEQTVSYENIIKIKYEDRIHFHMKIDSSLLPVRIPKLVVQPLVENCIKYALNVEPPGKFQSVVTGRIITGLFRYPTMGRDFRKNF